MNGVTAGLGNSRLGFAPILERRLVIEQNVAIRYCKHVIMKSAGIDGSGILLYKQFFSGFDLMKPRNRFTCFQRLPRRKLQRLVQPGLAERPNTKTSRPVSPCFEHSRMWLAAPSSAQYKFGWKRFMMLEIFGIAEHALQDDRSNRRLDAPVKLRRKVGRGYMDFAVFRIGAWGNRGSIRNPHARCRAACPQRPRRHSSRLADNRNIIPRKTQLPEHADRRPILRRQYALPDTQIGQVLHFREPLESGFAWIRAG